MNFLTNDGIKINYHVKGNGKPLIFVTGFGGHQEIWKLQVDYFSGLGYQVITYDHRNFGRSERTKKGHTLNRLTYDLIELVEHLGIKKAAFIGHSMGGSVLYNLIRLKPSIVQLAVIIDQTPFMINTTDWKYGFMNYTINNYIEEAKKVPNVHETLHGLDNRIMPSLKEAKVTHPFSRTDNFDLLCEHSTKDWRKVIQNASMPIFAVAAIKSPYYNSDFTTWMTQQNDNVKATLVANSGHDIMAEVPDHFNKILYNFLLENHYSSK